MKLILLLAFLTTIPYSIFAQNISANYQIDTLSAIQQEFKISLNGNFSNIKSIQIEFYQNIEGDTLLLFDSSYSFAENDPSGFKSFSSSENSYLLGLGKYESGIYFSKIYLRKQDETIETLLLN